jgi:hypothetical protein
MVTVLGVVPGFAANSTVTVTPADLETIQGPPGPAVWTSQKWFFYNDQNAGTDGVEGINNALGSFVTGPGNSLGVGSTQISVSLDKRRNLGTYRFRGTKLADITTLGFSTYNPSAGNNGSANRSGFLVMNVDFNGSDTWQRRLVYVPSQNGTVIQNTWQEWDAIAGGNALWGYSGATWPITGQPGTTLKTWSQILSDYPAVRIRVTDAFVGIRVGEPYADGYTENIDAFKFGVGTNSTTYDFEPYAVAQDKDDCKNGGWQTLKRADGSSFKNQGDCASYTNNGK